MAATDSEIRRRRRILDHAMLTNKPSRYYPRPRSTNLIQAFSKSGTLSAQAMGKYWVRVKVAVWWMGKGCWWSAGGDKDHLAILNSFPVRLASYIARSARSNKLLELFE